MTEKSPRWFQGRCPPCPWSGSHGLLHPRQSRALGLQATVGTCGAELRWALGECQRTPVASCTLPLRCVVLVSKVLGVGPGTSGATGMRAGSAG